MLEAIKDMVGLGEAARAYIIVQTRVYEGSFHFFAERCARRAGLKGWLRVIEKPLYNYIEMEVEGTKYKINKMIAEIQVTPNHPRNAKLDISWKTHKNMYQNFQVRI